MTEAQTPSKPLVRPLARALWFGVAPLLATLATMRWLVPPRSDVGPGLWGAFAEKAAIYPLPVATVLFLLFAGAVHVWRERLPLGRFLEPIAAAPRPLPQRITSLAL